MIELLSDPQVWIAFLTLTALELVLGIDNVIFISILVDKLPKERRELARRIGLFLAMFMRIGLLFLLSWIVGLTEPLFSTIPTGNLWSRPHPDRRRSLPALEEYKGDPPVTGGRNGRSFGGGPRHVFGRYPSDHDH